MGKQRQTALILGEGPTEFGNTNKSQFVWYFARFALPLHPYVATSFLVGLFFLK